MFTRVLVIAATASVASAEDWPDWRGAERDGRWHETGLVETLPDELEPMWRMPIGSGYSGPSVADGLVYITDRVMDPEEGERVHCFDAKTGDVVWSHTYECVYHELSYEAGPRCSVMIDDGRAYSLGAMGHLHCFDAKTGSVHWAHDLNEIYDIDQPIWGIAAAPMIDGDLLIVPVSGKDAYLVAFDRKTGEERWKAFGDRGNYAAPIMVEQAGKNVLVCWTGDRIIGVDPQSGSLHWEHDFGPKRMPLGVATPVATDDGRIFFTGFYDGCVLVQLDPDEMKVDELWRRRGQNEISTDGLQAIISTPFIDGEHIYGVDSYGQLRCLEMATGDRVWEDLTAVPKARWATIHMVRNGDKVWMFNERGELLIATMDTSGFHEIDRAKLIKPTREQLNQRGGVCWAHPAYADRCIFVRNDEEIVCASLAAGE